MSVYTRYFKVPADSQAHVRLSEIMDQHESAKKELMRIKDSVGADSVRACRETMKFGGFMFKPQIDSPDWTKPSRTDGSQRPRKTTAAGKRLWAEINAVPKCEDYHAALEVAGLCSKPFGSLVVGMRFYRTTLCWKRGAYMFVAVPWMDQDPEKLKCYQAERDAGVRSDSNMDHLLWEPPSDWVEVKRWEMDREIDEAKDPKEAA